MQQRRPADVLDDFRRYLKIEEGLSERTIDQHETMAGKFVEQAGEVVPDHEIAKAFQEWLIDEGYSKSHINNTMKALEYYYAFHGEDFEFTALNRGKTLPDLLTDAEVRRIQAACRTFRDYAIVKTLATSGIRNTELCNLDVRDVDFEAKTLRIRSGKGEKDGVARISSGCADAIEEYLNVREHQDADPLFLSRTGGRLTRNGVYQLVKRLADRADIEKNVTVHAFRHYFATSMIENGADVSVVKELMRHEDVSSTMKYLHIGDGTLGDQHDKYVEDL